MSQESLAEAPSLREGVSLLADPCPGMGFCPSASAVCVEQAVLTPLGCLTAELACEGLRWAGPGSWGFVSLLRVAQTLKMLLLQPPEPHLLSGSVTRRLLSAGRVFPVNLKLHF